MICSTGSSSRMSIPRAVLALLLVSGCALLDRDARPAIKSPAPDQRAFPVATRDTPIAVLPIENLSGERAPVDVAVRWLRARLERNGFRLIDEETLDTFMHRHRIRPASGLSRDESQAIKATIGAEAVLITSLAAYKERPPPEIALFSRLVSSGDQPEILWMDSVGLSGEDAAGLLGIGRIQETGALFEKVVHRLTASLAGYLPKTAPGASLPNATYADEIRGRDAPSEEEVDEFRISRDTSARYAPRSVFRSPLEDARGRYSVAVIPFVNLSERKNAGSIMMLHFVEELTRVDGIRVVDPGLVREEMLRYRTMIPEGPSLSTADLLSSDRSLGIDLLLSGTVFDYGGALVPKVDFSVEIIDTASREVVWTSRSYNDGEEGVFFLDVGRVYTAHRLAADMARAAVGQLRQ